MLFMTMKNFRRNTNIEICCKKTITFLSVKPKWHGIEGGGGGGRVARYFGGRYWGFYNTQKKNGENNGGTVFRGTRYYGAGIVFFYSNCNFQIILFSCILFAF